MMGCIYCHSTRNILHFSTNSEDVYSHGGICIDCLAEEIWSKISQKIAEMESHEIVSKVECEQCGKKPILGVTVYWTVIAERGEDANKFAHFCSFKCLKKWIESNE